jgi:hypothetical protein
MKRGTSTGIFGTIIVVGFSLGAFADVKENPYQVIIDRNPFALKAIPTTEAPKPPEAPVIPPPQIKLTGIETLGEQPKALLQVEDKQTKKAEFPPPLAAGENYKGIMVVSIDVENNTVRIKNDDAETTLDFINYGVETVLTGAAPVPHPGIVCRSACRFQAHRAARGRITNSAISQSSRRVEWPHRAGQRRDDGARGSSSEQSFLILAVVRCRRGPAHRQSGLVAGGGNQVLQSEPAAGRHKPVPTATARKAGRALRHSAKSCNKKAIRTHIILPPTSLSRSLSQPPTPGAPGVPQ